MGRSGSATLTASSRARHARHRRPAMNTRLLALLALLTVLPAFAASHPSSDTAPARPGLRFEPEIRAFAEADRARPPVPGGILFVGSSIFRLWTNVAEMMAPLPVLNRAF